MPAPFSRPHYRPNAMPTRTELIWDGKYDANGKRTPVFRVALPFQTIETVNESAGERKSLFSAVDSEKPWRNRLIWGDKKYVLPSLLPEFAGKVDLIYIDPPFDTGADFSFTATVPDSPDGEEGDGVVFTKHASIIEQKAYRDTWGRGIDSYLHWFYETAIVLHELLSDTGSIYVHVGQEVSHNVRAILDEIFGSEHFINEIIWKRSHAHSDGKQGSSHYGRLHESIFYYSKSDNFKFKQLYRPYELDYVNTYYKYIEEGTGRRYWLDNLQGPGGGAAGNPSYEVMGVTRFWRYSKKRMAELVKEGRIIQTSPGTVPKYKRYLDEMPGRPIQDIWDDIKSLAGLGANENERLGYPTQKPETLLSRVINTSSSEDDLVLDCFAGSGTTAAVAEKLGRRWITCDLGRFAIHTTRKRMLGIADVKPFIVQNLGKYERQLWQTGRFAADGPESNAQADARNKAYVEFLLSLYHATPVGGHTWIHGQKGGRFVHVGGVDGPVTAGDVRNLVTEFKKAIGQGKNAPPSNGLDVLGWDFAFELNEVVKQQAEGSNVSLKFKRIPRDVMDPRAAAQGDVHFFEMASLGVKATTKGKMLTLELTDFVIPPDDVPEEVRDKVKHWSQWIDFWAVDFNHAGDTFHNEWQAFRTKKDATLTLETKHPYPEAGEYRVMVKVIDILGNDTTKTLAVKVKA